MTGFAVVGLTDAYISSLGIFLDTFELIRRQVSELYRTREPIAMQTKIHLLTEGGRAVHLAGGRTLSSDGGFDTQVQYDLIHLPGFIVGDEAALSARLADAAPLCHWLSRQHAGGGASSLPVVQPSSCSQRRAC